MNNLSWSAKAYILITLLFGATLISWMAMNLDWSNTWLFTLAALGAVAQTLKLEGPDARTNYSIAWFVYGFAFLVLNPLSALFVVVIAHLVEWAWHKYPWYIQSFNIGAHVIPLFVAGLLFELLDQGGQVLDLNTALGIALASLTFVLGNHLMVGWVVKLARGRSFAESGVLGTFTLFLDFTVLSMGAVTALLWRSSPFSAVLNMLPLYLLYNALRVPALKRQLQELKATRTQVTLSASGD
jgi:hypothetical protein